MKKPKRWRGTLDDQLSRLIYDRLYLGDSHMYDGQRDRVHREISGPPIGRRRWEWMMATGRDKKGRPQPPGW